MKPHIKNKRKAPLRIYLSSAFLIFSAVLLVFMWLFQTVFLDAFYKSIKVRQVKSCAQSIASQVQSDELSELITNIREQNSMSISVYDTSQAIFVPVYTPDQFSLSSGTVSLSSIYSYYSQAKDNSGTVTIIDKIQSHSGRGGAFKPSGQFGQDFSFSGKAPSLERESVESLTYATITQTDNAEFLVVVESEITPVTSTVETLRFQLVIITIIMIIISIVIAVITAHSIAKPITDTTERAKELARQNYELSFSKGKYRELCELNETLNFAAQELSKVDSLRKELIANISHDLRTPLTMITGYSEVMRDLPGENTPENIQIVIDEANRLNMLVTDLLDISKLESGAVSLERNSFSLTDCVRGILTRYTKLIKQDGYNISFVCDGEAEIFADELRITQVLYNLINNAINYVGSDKTVIVKQTLQDECVRIDIIDHGSGIPADKLEYIWDRYYKVDKEHKQAVIGTGLGLSIVKNILDMHNARYGVNSQEGNGSDFWFELDTVQSNKE